MTHFKTINAVAMTAMIATTMLTMTACGESEAPTSTTNATSTTSQTSASSADTGSASTTPDAPASQDVSASQDVPATQVAPATTSPTPMTKAEMDAEHEKVAISREALTLAQTEEYVKYVEADGGLGFRSNLVIPHDPANTITCDKAMGEYLGNVNYSANNGHCTLVVPSKGATYDVKLQYVTDTTANVRRQIVVKKR